MRQCVCILLVLYLCSFTAAYKTIIDVLSEHDRFEQLVVHLQRLRLIPFVNQLESGTFFAPDNEAFTKYNGWPISRDQLLYHILPDLYKYWDLKSGRLLESALIRPHFLSNNTGQRIKVTQHLGFIKVNQARIITKDIYVNANTMIHAIDRLMEPPKMLSDIVAQTDKPQFSLMQKTHVADMLDDTRPFTVFVSTSQLLEKFSETEAAYLLSGYGQEDLSQLLKFLVVNDTIYDDTFSQEPVQYTTLSGDAITVNRQKNGRLQVNGIPVRSSDIIAANGVVHVLDDIPLWPGISFNIRKCLYGMKATKFVSLFDAYDLGRYIDSDAKNYTLLAVPDDTLDDGAIPDNDKEAWLRYHIISGMWTTDRLQDRMLLLTEYQSRWLDGDRQRLQVRVDVRSEKGRANRQSPIIQFGDAIALRDVVTVNGVNLLYQLQAPLTLPTDVLSAMITDLDLSTLIATLYMSGDAEIIKQATGGITVFAPTNNAFKQLGLVTKFLMHPRGRPDLHIVLQHHVASALLYAQDLVNTYDVLTLANTTLRVGGYDEHNRIRIGWPNQQHDGVLVDTDRLISSGVIHTTESVQIPSTVNITHEKLLQTMDATIMVNLLKRSGLLADIESHGDYLVLVPNDHAFASVDVASLKDDDIARLCRLHVLRATSPTIEWPPFGQPDEYTSLLSDRDKVVMRKIGDGRWVAEVKDSKQGHAHVLAMGDVTTGNGKVFELDGVLLPVRRGFFGLPWLWSTLLTVIVALSSVTALGFTLYQYVQQWRGKQQQKQQQQQQEEESSSSSSHAPQDEASQQDNTLDETTPLLRQ